MLLFSFEKVLMLVDSMGIDEHAMAKLVLMIIKYLITMAHAGLGAGSELTDEDCPTGFTKECPDEREITFMLTSGCFCAEYNLGEYIRTQPITREESRHLMDDLMQLGNQVFVAGYMYSVDRKRDEVYGSGDFSHSRVG